MNLKDTTLTEIIFENSYRDRDFKNIIIKFDKIEEILTKKLLSKKKLLNTKINGIIFIDEQYLHEHTSKYNEFINNYKPNKNLSSLEKLKINKYFINNINNYEMCLNIIKDFDYIILNLNKKFNKIGDLNEIDEQNIKDNSKIQEIKKKIQNEKEMKIKDVLKSKNLSQIDNDNFSNEFNGLLKICEDLIFEKLIDLFYFTEKLMFRIIKKELSKFCSNILSERNKKEINEFFTKDKLITKEILSNAIRRFLTRYLIKEKDKEKNINSRNFIKFFDIEDLWDDEINKKEEKKEIEIEKIKSMNISINQILSLYDEIGGDNAILEEMKELKETDILENKINEKIEDNDNEEDEKDEDTYSNDEGDNYIREDY